MPATTAWERLAEPRGGTVAGLTATRGEVLAATWAGVHRSRDGGTTWEPTASGPSVPFAEAVAAADERTLFAAASDGLYRSTDGGETWERRLTGSRVLCLAATPELVLAGSEADGVLRSEDNGRTWTGANAGLRDTSVLSLALSPTFAKDHLGFAGTASGLYRTRSGGRAWREVELGLTDEAAVQCIAFVSGAESNVTVLLGTERHGLLHSDDTGVHWSVAQALAGRSVTALASDARGRIAAATDCGVWMSHDGGRSWRLTGAELGPVLSLAFAGSVLLAGLPRDGVARSEDGGVTWSLEAPGLAAGVVLGLALSPRFGQDASLFSAGLQRGLEWSSDGGRTWAARNDGLEGAVLAVAHGRNGQLFAATSAGVYRSTNAGCTWRRTTDADLNVTAIAAVKRNEASTPQARGGAADMVVAATDVHGVIVSDDGGQTWRALEALTEPAEIVALQIAADGTLLLGTRDEDGQASVWRRTRQTPRWERILREPAEGALSLAVGPGGNVLGGLGGCVLRVVEHSHELRGGERRPVWRAARMPRNAQITSVVTVPAWQAGADPARTGSREAGGNSVFVSTGEGVFVSRDEDERFASWSEGLTQRAVVALAVSPNYAQDRLVFAVGLGGAIWRRVDR